MGRADFLGKRHAQRPERKARGEVLHILKRAVFEKSGREFELPDGRHGQAAFFGEAAHEILHGQPVTGNIVALEEI